MQHAGTNTPGVRAHDGNRVLHSVLFAEGNARLQHRAAGGKNDRRCGSLSKMEKDGLIQRTQEVEKRKLYRITPLGREVLALECKRIERLYQNSKGEWLS